MKKWRILKLDATFDTEIRKFAKKNNLKLMDASRELANFIREQSNGRKKRREIIKIIKNVEF